MAQAIGSVAERLGNRPAICRKSHVHPAVVEAYLDGSLTEAMARRAERETATRDADLRPEEACVLALLEARLGSAATVKAA